MTPRKRICCAVEACSLARWQVQTVKDSVQCIRDTVVESVISLILEGANGNQMKDKIKVDTEGNEKADELAKMRADLDKSSSTEWLASELQLERAK